MSKKDMRLYRPTWKAKDGEKKKSSRWWLDFTDANARRLRLPGLTDKRQTEALARNVERLLSVRASGDALPADLLRWLETIPADFRRRLADAGLIDADRVGGAVPLMILDGEQKITGGHLFDFLADAKARGVSKIQRTLLAQRTRDVLTKAKTKWLRDLSTAKIQAAISSFGESTDEHPDGLSKQSLQHYVKAVKQFSRWLHRERRTAEDILLGLKGYNAETDKRHERRGFTAEEMAALLSATRQGPVRFCMAGPARAASYALAFASGLRRNEIRTLTADSFDLLSDTPTVTVEAAYSKHRRRDVQPIPADVAELLAEYLPSTDADRPFPLPDKTGKMLHADMADARQAVGREGDADFLMPRDSADLVLDFHSFRHAFVSAICKANVSPRVMMHLARHSDPRLTMKRYSRVSIADTASALDALPKLNGEPDERQELRATGTYDVTPVANTPTAPRIDERTQGRPVDRPGEENRFYGAQKASCTSADFDGREAEKSDAKPTPENSPQRFAKIFAKSPRFSRSDADCHGREAKIANAKKTLAGDGKIAIIKGPYQSSARSSMDRASVYGTEAANPQLSETPSTYKNGNPCACQNLCQNAAKSTPETGGVNPGEGRAPTPADITPGIPGEAYPETIPPDPGLASLIDAWPTLPEPVKAGILAMVNVTLHSQKGDNHG